MKIIAFNWSPRKNGNTSTLIKTVFEELKKENIETEIEKPKFQPNGIIDELQYLQEENKETLQEAERLLRRLSEATWQFEVKTGCTPANN